MSYGSNPCRCNRAVRLVCILNSDKAGLYIGKGDIGDDRAIRIEGDICQCVERNMYR